MSCSANNVKIEECESNLLIRFAPQSDFTEPVLQKIEKELTGEINGTSATSVVISFKGVPLITSHMLGVLVRLRDLASKKQLTFHLTDLSDLNLKLFQLTRLDTIFQFFATEADALARKGAA